MITVFLFSFYFTHFMKHIRSPVLMHSVTSPVSSLSNSLKPQQLNPDTGHTFLQTRLLCWLLQHPVTAPFPRQTVSHALEKDNTSALQEVTVFAVLFYCLGHQTVGMVKERMEFIIILYQGAEVFQKDKHYQSYAFIDFIIFGTRL